MPVPQGYICNISGIKVLIKQCSKCNFPVRFQNFKSGFHNYNNNIVLSLKLCQYLTRGVEVSSTCL